MLYQIRLEMVPMEGKGINSKPFDSCLIAIADKKGGGYIALDGMIVSGTHGAQGPTMTSKAFQCDQQGAPQGDLVTVITDSFARISREHNRTPSGFRTIAPAPPAALSSPP